MKNLPVVQTVADLMRATVDGATGALNIRLTDGIVVPVDVQGVLNDGLLCNRRDNPKRTLCVIPFHAISMMEAIYDA